MIDHKQFMPRALEWARGKCRDGKDRLEDAGCVEDLAILLASVAEEAKGQGKKRHRNDALDEAWNETGKRCNCGDNILALKSKSTKEETK